MDEATPQPYSLQQRPPVRGPDHTAVQGLGCQTFFHYRAPELTAVMQHSWSQSPRATTATSSFADSPWLMAVSLPQPFLQDKQPHSFRSSRLFSAWLLPFRASSL